MDQEFHRITFQRKENSFYVILAGRFSRKNFNIFNEEIKKEISSPQAPSVIFDFSEVTYLDSIAALTFFQMQKDLAGRGVNVQLIHLSDEAQGIFSVIHSDALEQRPLKSLADNEGFIQKIGQASLTVARDFADFISFTGALLVAFLQTIRNPKTLRKQDVLFYVQRAGVDGLPIVGLIGALIGLIIAFMSFLQLKMIGANIYVPALVSFALIKELGPIMTAILVAGRSGSAYAAEIGTMMVNEEVAALQTMGFDPVRFLAVPKVLATVIVVPILTIYADFFGVIGGMIIGVTSLDLTVQTYITQSLKTIKLFDVVTSLIKAGVFAALIAAIGCQKGFEVREGAQDVGKFTTSAVVNAIFMIVVADSIFAIMFYYIK